MVICLEQGADLHLTQLMPLPLTVSCYNKIQIGYTFLVPAHLGSPGERAVKRVCVCVCVCACACACACACVCVCVFCEICTLCLVKKIPNILAVIRVCVEYVILIIFGTNVSQNVDS